MSRCLSEQSSPDVAERPAGEMIGLRTSKLEGGRAKARTMGQALAPLKLKTVVDELRPGAHERVQPPRRPVGTAAVQKGVERAEGLLVAGVRHCAWA